MVVDEMNDGVELSRLRSSALYSRPRDAKSELFLQQQLDTFVFSRTIEYFV